MRVMAEHIEPKDRTAQGIAVTQLIFQIFIANGRLIRVGDKLSSEYGLTSARWQVLGVISDRPRTVAQIARQFELTRQGVLWVVQALEKDGLVRLVRNPDHKRSKLVQLTPEGELALRGALDRQIRWSNDLGSSFDAQSVEAAIDVLSRFNDLLEDAEGTEETDESAS